MNLIDMKNLRQNSTSLFRLSKINELFFAVFSRLKKVKSGQIGLTENSSFPARISAEVFFVFRFGNKPITSQSDYYEQSTDLIG